MQRTEASLPAVYEVSDPSRDMSFTFQDFEVSLARMLNGERTAGEVVEAAGQIGIPLTLEGLEKFIAQLQRSGLFEKAETVVERSSPSPEDPKRATCGSR